MRAGGVIGVARSIWDDPDFKDEPFTERQAFIWLVSESAWKDRTVRGARGPVRLKRGEFCHSIRFMGRAWDWPKSRVERFIKRLKKRDTIRDARRDSEQIYLVKNYNVFQIVGTPTGTANGTLSGTQSGQTIRREEDIVEDLSQSFVNNKPVDKREKFPVQKAFENWNIAATAWGLPVARDLTPDRRKKIHARLREHGLERWNEALANIEHSEFLRGGGNRAWRANLDFVLQPSSFNKLLEGTYANEVEA